MKSNKLALAAILLTVIMFISCGDDPPPKINASNQVGVGFNTIAAGEEIGILDSLSASQDTTRSHMYTPGSKGICEICLKFDCQYSDIDGQIDAIR